MNKKNVTHMYRGIVLAALIACLIVQAMTIVAMKKQVHTLQTEIAQAHTDTVTSSLALGEKVSAVARQVEEQDRLIGELERMVNYTLEN